MFLCPPDACIRTRSSPDPLLLADLVGLRRAPTSSATARAPPPASPTTFPGSRSSRAILGQGQSEPRQGRGWSFSTHGPVVYRRRRPRRRTQWWSLVMALMALTPEVPYLAAGTISSAVDFQFSVSANFEIYTSRSHRQPLGCVGDEFKVVVAVAMESSRSPNVDLEILSKLIEYYNKHVQSCALPQRLLHQIASRLVFLVDANARVLREEGAESGVSSLVELVGDMATDGTKTTTPALRLDEPDYGVVSIHHVGILCENLERSIALYHDILGIKVNLARPNDKLSYKGAWLWVGSEMIHLMELPNPDPGITKQIWAASVLIVQFLGY